MMFPGEFPSAVVAAVALVTVVLVAALVAARCPRARRPLRAVGLAGAVAVIPAAVFAAPATPAPRVVADDCLVTVPAGVVIPACGPGLSGGSVSAGAPSQQLITLKNWCNLVIGGCSSAFFYPPGPVRLPNVDNTVRHSP